MGTVFIQDLAVVLLVAGVVGVISQRLRISVVLGFLVAGVLIGPYTPPFQLVEDRDRVQMLADVGLVFLIFAIGLDLNLKRLQRLGPAIALATFLGAILVLNFGRLLGLALGWDGTQSLFLAAVLMVSSSAIISKVLEELNQTHEQSAQLALGVTVLEDSVAIVMLTLLTSLIRLGETKAGDVIPMVGGLGMFVAVLFLASLLAVPWMLRLLDRYSGAELRNILVIGLVLGLAWLAVRAGYSLALAAFVLGAIIGSTRQKRDVERAVEGLRHIFGAVFFVAMGMLLDLQLLWESLPLVLLISACAIVARVTSCTIGLLSIGTSLRPALRAGLTLTPIGEFSFIIAQLGVVSGVVPRSFYPIALGLSLVTALTGPILTKRSGAIAARIESLLPRFVHQAVRTYHDAFIERAGRPAARSRESLRRLLPAGAHVTLASVVLLSLESAYRYVADWLGTDWFFPRGLEVSSGLLIGIVLLLPMSAAWRHLAAFGTTVMARVRAPGELSSASTSELLTVAFRVVVAIFLAGWFVALLPFGFSVLWSLMIAAGALIGVALAFFRPINRLRARVEDQVRDQLRAAQSPPSAVRLARALKDKPSEWNVQLEEVLLPDYASYSGKSIGELAIRPRFGCSVVGIDRRGFVILNPSREEVLYPGDRVLLLGTAAQIDAAETFLRGSSAEAERADGFEELTVESHVVGEASPIGDRPLSELDLIRRFGVQIGAIQRSGRPLEAPSGATKLQPNDELLIVGTPQSMRDFLAWASEPRGAAPA